METKQTSIQIKVDKSVSKQLKKRAKQKGMIYSSYIRQLIIDSIEKDDNYKGDKQK